MAIIVFQHSEANRPGRLGLILRDQAFNLDIRRVDLGEPIPSDFDDVTGVISLGGPQEVGGPEPWLGAEIEFLRGAHERELPVVGICLGHQLLAAALGGEVTRMDRPEVGMQDLDLLPPGQTDPILAGIAWQSRQFLSHAFEVSSAPPGATVLARTSACAVQVFHAGLRSYGFQHHFEADRDLAREIAQEARELFNQGGLTIHEFEEQVATAYESFARLGDRLCMNIATFLIPRVATVIG